MRDGAHDGCWQHDLVTLYRELGYESEALEPGYAAHTPVRVVVASAPRFTWSPVVLALYRRLEQDMDAGQTALREHSTAVQEELDRARVRCAELERLLAASEERATELERQRAEDKARITALLLERERFLAGLYRHIRR